MERDIKHANVVVSKVKEQRMGIIHLQRRLSLDLDFMGCSRDYCNEKIDGLIIQCKELKRQLKAIEKMKNEK